MIDLQLHTLDSDGTWPWDKVLETCLKLGLKAYAITDHDTIDRRQDILNWAERNKAMAIPGIEISTEEKGESVHLLGYFLDGPLSALEGKLAYLRGERSVRNKEIIRKLQKLGFPVNDEDVKREAGSGTVGRPHIARVLLRKGIVKSVQEAFGRYLGAKGSAYVRKEELPLREAIELFHGAGAVAIVSHPGFLKRSADDLEESFQEWKGWGLDGLEAIYPGYTEQQKSFFLRVAHKYGLLITGGSDFHGDNKPLIKIGVGLGSLDVPDHILEPLLERRRELKSTP